MNMLWGVAHVLQSNRDVRIKPASGQAPRAQRVSLPVAVSGPLSTNAKGVQS